MDVLPVDGVVDGITRAARRGGFALAAPPGAGKTTRVPPALAAAGVPGVIVVAEPRRVAARAAAARIAAERGEPVGKSVGHHVRFDRRGGPDTRIWVVTDGILLRMLERDPLLDGVGAVIVDEVHERGLEAELALALLREVREARPELCVGAMSATADTERFATYLGVDVVRCDGRAHPVDVAYLPFPDGRPVEDLVVDAVRRELDRPGGDLLVFLPGVGPIRRVRERLAPAATAAGSDLVELYGDLPPAAQDRALARGPRRRVVLSTNVAETSVTVPGVTVVVDSGLARRPRLDPASGLDHLDTVRISRASAEQRAGRAGRVAPGRAVRLWTEREHHDRDAFDAPEVVRVDLCGPVLQILAWGADPRRFAWLEAPPADAVDAALETLGALGAVDAGGHLTDEGRRLAGFPVHPRLGRLLLEGARLGHVDDAALAAAVLADRDPAPSGPGSAAPSPSDVVDRVDAALREGGALGRAQDQLAALAREVVGRGGRRDVDREEALGRAVLAGWPDRVVRRREVGSDRGRMVGGKGVRLDPSSAVRDGELFVAVSVTADAPDARVRVASRVDPGWLPVVTERVVSFDAASGAVRGRRIERYRDLELRAFPESVDLGQAAQCLEEALEQDVAIAIPREGAYPALAARLAALERWDGPRSWVVPPAALLPAVCRGCRTVDEVRRADWVGAVRDHLGWARWTELERRAPERVVVPSGRAIAVDWAPDPPVVEVRIQELFGATAGPTVDGGRVRLRLHLLAPNGRPQQITDDLAGFWERTYAQVRGELRARYPKHAWPEDPRAAAPEARPRRRT